MADLVGKTLAKQYQVIEFIGRGGMAEVYKVWDPERMIYLAAKVLLKSLAMDQVFLRRFKREADSLAKLQHPNIVRYYGLYQDEDIAFMLLDFFEGVSLQEWIFKQGRKMSTGMIMEIVRSLSSALHYAHTKGLVHCDIKPGNIMIDRNNNILLTDFGIARMTDAATATMVGFGTPAYMAPELVYGKDPTPQSDIYSLGVVLYEMFTGGERPFTGERAQTTGTNSEKVRWEQVFIAPPLPRQHNPQLSEQMETVIMRCLAKDSGNRFKSALDLMNAIELASSGKLNTQNWPQHPEQPITGDQYVPLTPVFSHQPISKSQVEAQKPQPKQSNLGIKLIFPIVAGLGIGLILFVFLLIIWLRPPPSPNSEINQPAASLDGDLAQPVSDTHISIQSPKSTHALIDTATAEPVVLPIYTPTILVADPTSTKAVPITSTSSVYITPTPKLYHPLADCAPSHLKLGDSAFINYEGGKNNIRNEPDTHPSDNVIGVVYPGEVVLIVGGPVCNYGWLLWEVQTTRNEKGWTPETDGKDFWLLPLTTRQLCDGALPTRLVVGKKAKVNEVPALANLIRVEPSRFDDDIGRIQPGDWMMVLEGPYCGEKANWWKVEALSTGIVGWTLEGNLEIYYLSPEP